MNTTESDYPYATVAERKINFCDGRLIKLPKEYLKVCNKSKLNEFYTKLFANCSSTDIISGIDPIKFNYVKCKDICIIGILFESLRDSEYNTHKKKYPHNKFEKEYILSKIENERKLINLEEYLPIHFVTQNIHELRNLNSKMSSNIDDILNIKDEGDWETKFDEANENIKKIYVASRLIKFILDNVKFYMPNYIEDMKIDYERVFTIHRCVSKIVKIYRNDFKKRKSNINLEGNSFKKTKGDKEIFEIALMLLIENALKYSNDASSIPPKVIIKEAQKNNDVVITISSFGKIIPEEDKKFLFTRGFRSSAHNQREGSGMGLHNASRILQRFQASLSYSNEIVETEIGWNSFTITCSDTFRE